MPFEAPYACQRYSVYAFPAFQTSRLSGLLFLHHATLKVGHAGLCLFLCGIHRISGLCRHILDILFDSILPCLSLYFSYLRQHPPLSLLAVPCWKWYCPRFSFRSCIFFFPLVLPATALPATAPATPPEIPPALTALAIRCSHTPSPMSHKQIRSAENPASHDFDCR